jgi:hypothetical protein
MCYLDTIGTREAQANVEMLLGPDENAGGEPVEELVAAVSVPEGRSLVRRDFRPLFMRLDNGSRTAIYGRPAGEVADQVCREGLVAGEDRPCAG